MSRPTPSPIPLPPLTKPNKSKIDPKPLTKPSNKVGKAAKGSVRPTLAKSSKQKARPQLSEELVVDSSDDDDNAPAQPITNGTINSKIVNTQSKINGVTSSSADERATDSEDGDIHSEADAELQSTTAATSKQISEQALDIDPQPVPAVAESIPTTTNKKHKTSALRPVRPFDPPRGYKDASNGAHTKHVRLLERTSLAGKQLWYISAPATLNLSKIQELSLEQLKGKMAVFQQEGDEYALQAEDQETSPAIQIMLPGENDYVAVPSKVVLQYRLQHRVRLPDPTVSKQTYTRTKRQQPPGMRTRWRPAGAKKLEDGDSDIEVVANQSLLDQHTVTISGSAHKKRKHRDEDASDKADRKKEKKRKKDRAAEMVTNPGEEGAKRAGPSQSTPDSPRLQDGTRGATTPAVSSSSQARDKGKRKKRQPQVDEQGDVSMVPAPVSVPAAASNPKSNGTKSIVPPDMVHPASEVRKEKKKKREKDKTSARELMDLTNI